jgi:hypothetical protein
MVPTPGFPNGTLDDLGFPVWITDLDNDDTADRTLHVVRGLAPRDALEMVGAQPGTIVPCQLPPQRPAQGTSLPRAAIGSPDSSAVLLAGQVGAWTFVHDDAGVTCLVADGVRANRLAPPAKRLSAGGREAASSTCGISLSDTAYAVDGKLVLHVTDDEIEPEDDDVPPGLRAAIYAAGAFQSWDDPDDEVDSAVNLRVLCALARLKVTLDDLRQIPLLAAPLG